MKQIFLLLFILAHSMLKSQTKIVFNPMNSDTLKNQFCFNLGLGYEDGLIYLKNNRIPTFGMSYERRLSKYVSFATHLLIYYRTYIDQYPLGTLAGHPSLYHFRGANSPFMSQAEKDKLAQSGVWTLDPNQVIKTLSIPIDIGFTVYPLSTKHHRMGVNTAFCMTYESHNWWRDEFSGVLTRTDGSKTNVTLSVPTEYRNISPGMSLKWMYEYQFKRYAIGGRFSSYNVLFSDTFFSNIAPNEVVWESSLYMGFKF